MNHNGREQTLVLIKPDALKLSLSGYLLSLLSESHTGLMITGSKIVSVSRMLAEEHYAEHAGKVFYDSLLEYIMGEIHFPDDPGKRRVKVLVYQGKDAVKKIREIAGPTNPHIAREEKPGCIRSLGTVIPLKNGAGEIVGNRIDNLIHASASVEEAEREIKLWLKPNDIPPLLRAYSCRQSEEHIYCKDNMIFKKYESGSVCLLTPGDMVWESDWKALCAILEGAQPACSLRSIAAKYLINEDRTIG
ncbi:MAG: nucleoside-diphosphate kinase [Candidatus Omnitrophota bacterium]